MGQRIVYVELHYLFLKIQFRELLEHTNMPNLGCSLVTYKVILWCQKEIKEVQVSRRGREFKAS
ncbi:MAG: hypothetical protein DRO13_04755 [Thermoprotei archaeon]|nr:MAG: hypothetical protein DRO13_04755 [Thermoprotei archaeon]